jgi:hypothetical protein
MAVTNGSGIVFADFLHKRELRLGEKSAARQVPAEVAGSEADNEEKKI